MKKMTMRDVADIVLVLVGFTFFIRLLTSLLSLGIGIIIATPENQLYKQSNIPIILIQTSYVLILWGCVLFLFIRRNTLLNLIFPKAEKKAVDLSNSARSLSDYAFWIRLLGAIIFLLSGIEFISHLVSETIQRKRLPGIRYSSYWWTEGIPGLISFILAVVVIWKANQISQFLNRLGLRKISNTGSKKR